MSVRPFEASDLAAVAALYERVMRSGGSPPAPGLEQYFRRIADHPWDDPELPSLVWDDRGAGVVAFLGSHSRRLRMEDRSLRLACAGQLVAESSFRKRGVGALLLRTYMAGPQDLTITDGATDEVRTMWEAFDGRSLVGASIAWTVVLAPAAYGAALMERRSGPSRKARAAARLSRAVDPIAGRPLRPEFPAGRTEVLTPELLVEEISRLERTFRLRPAYDARYATWLFRELEAVTARGRLTRTLVRGRDGRSLGWFVAYLLEGGVSQVLQLVATGRTVGAVLDHLLWQAWDADSAAVQGRIDPHLFPELRTRRCLMRRTEWALIQGNETALAAITGGDGLLTRLEGEWWMGHHLTPLPA